MFVLYPTAAIVYIILRARLIFGFTRVSQMWCVRLLVDEQNKQTETTFFE